MSLNNDDIKKIAHLARLNISTEAEESLKNDLNNIFVLVDKIQKTDTNNIEPMSHSYEVSQRLAEDKINEPNVREAMQEIAPEKEAGLYLVPKVVE